VAAPIVMAMVALLGSDRFGFIGGAIAIVVGPLVYLLDLRCRHPDSRPA